MNRAKTPSTDFPEKTELFRALHNNPDVWFDVTEDVTHHSFYAYGRLHYTNEPIEIVIRNGVVFARWVTADEWS